MIVTAAGLGMLFMPVTLIALNRVPDRDAGLAASLPNVGQQVGGSIGLALLGTVAWTVVANTARHSAEAAKAAAATAAKAGHPVHVSAAGEVGHRGDLRPRTVDRVLPRVRGVSRDHAARPHRDDRGDPADPRGPGRRRRGHPRTPASAEPAVEPANSERPFAPEPHLVTRQAGIHPRPGHPAAQAVGSVPRPGSRRLQPRRATIPAPAKRTPSTMWPGPVCTAQVEAARSTARAARPAGSGRNQMRRPRGPGRSLIAPRASPAR